MALLQRSRVTCKEFSIRHANTGRDQEWRLSQIVDNLKILSVDLWKLWHYLLSFLLLLLLGFLFVCLLPVGCFLGVFFCQKTLSSTLTERTSMPNWPNASREGGSWTSWMATEGGPDIRHAVDRRKTDTYKPHVCVVREKNNSSHGFFTRVITRLLIYLW